MVSNHGHVYLVDFGLSIHEGSDANTETGTLEFMAPEVLTKKTYRCNADVWSLGMTVVQMVNGLTPYESVSEHEVRKFIISNQRPHIHYDMPLDMTDFLNQCLEWDPASRTSASNLLEHEFLHTKATPKALGELVQEAQKCKDEEDKDSDSDSDSDSSHLL